jgi:sugar lactone lactonase YvrE
VETIFEDIGVSNGIGFSPDNKIMCERLWSAFGHAREKSNSQAFEIAKDYIDSPTRVIYKMDFDLVSLHSTMARYIYLLTREPSLQETGRVSNRQQLVDSSSFDAGLFDGLCMDAEGAIWAARWGNNRVVRVLPDGTVDMEIVIPGARNITCCVFGGEFVRIAVHQQKISNATWVYIYRG